MNTLSAAPPLAPHEATEAQAALDEVLAAAELTKEVRPEKILATLHLPDAVVAGRVVHFIRHGIGHHNVWGADWAKAAKLGNAYIDVGCPVDAQLTAVGVSQAQSLQPKLAALLKESACTQVYVSPLRRAVETALQAVNGLPVKVQANELLHEQAGLHHCDRRLDTPELQLQFPTVDFSAIESVSDPLWGDGAVREPSASVLARAYEFMLWLRDQPPGPVQQLMLQCRAAPCLLPGTGSRCALYSGHRIHRASAVELRFELRCIQVSTVPQRSQFPSQVASSCSD
eukprot:16513-Heterococcus_DN1.PRE.1